MGAIAPGIGDTQSFSNIKNPSTAKTSRVALKFPSPIRLVQQMLASVGTVNKYYRPRYLAHAGFLGIAAFLVIGNSPDRAHSVSVRLMSAQAGLGSSLDATATANRHA